MTRWRRGRRGEDGVIAVFVAVVSCFVLVPIAAFAVDIGVQRVATRDMQALADVVALDVARQIDGRTYSELQPQLQTWADASAARNGTIGHGQVVHAELGIIDASKYATTNPGAVFVPVTSDAGGIPNAVRVTASTTVDFSIQGGSGGATRTAIAQTTASACFAVGSYALNMSSQKASLLNNLIGSALNVSAVSYTGLASAGVSLQGLATELHVGTVDALLQLKNLSLNDLFAASATALSKEGGSAAQVAVLNQLAAANLTSLAHINFGDLVSMDSGSGSAFQTKVNVLDLVAGSAFLANGTNLLSVPSITAGVPGVGSVSISNLRIIQAPIVKCGPIGTSQQTSQVTLDMTVNLTNTTLLSVLNASSKLTLHAGLANATGTLTKIVCGSPQGIDVSVASSLSQLSADLTTNLTTLLGVPVARVDGHTGTVGPATTSTVSIRIPPNTYDQPVSSGSGVVLSPMTLSNDNVTLLGALPLGVTVSGIVNAVTSSIVTPTVNPLIANLDNQVFAPLSDALGLQLGGADIFAVQQPTCDQVGLVG